MSFKPFHQIVKKDKRGHEKRCEGKNGTLDSNSCEEKIRRLKKMTKRVLYISNLDDIINIYVANLGNFQLVVATDTGDRVSPKVAIVSPVDTELQLDFSLLTFPISPF